MLHAQMSLPILNLPDTHPADPAILPPYNPHLPSSHAQFFLMAGRGSRGDATPKNPVYGATKQALVQLSASLAASVQGSPVSVHLVSPGMVATDLLLPLADTAKSGGEKGGDGVGWRGGVSLISMREDLDGPVRGLGEGGSHHVCIQLSARERLCLRCIPPHAFPCAARLINILAEEPETVAGWLVPRLRGATGNGGYLQYLTIPGALFRFATAGRRRNRFVSESQSRVGAGFTRI